MTFDVVAFGAHPDDLEVSMGGTVRKLVTAGLRVLFVDVTDGEPARYGGAGERGTQAARAASILGVELILDPGLDAALRQVRRSGCAPSERPTA